MMALQRPGLLGNQNNLFSSLHLFFIPKSLLVGRTFAHTRLDDPQLAQMPTAGALLAETMQIFMVMS